MQSQQSFKNKNLQKKQKILCIFIEAEDSKYLHLSNLEAFVILSKDGKPVSVANFECYQSETVSTE